MADRLHVTERTVRTIESNGGQIEASVNMAIAWLEICGINPLRFFRERLQPDVYAGSQDLSVSELRAALADYINHEAGELELRQLYFAMHGKHGSSWIAWLQKGMADLHTPLADRYSSVELIRSRYLLARQRGNLICPDEALPVMPLLDAAISGSLEAIYSGREGYAGAVTNQNEREQK